MNGQISLFDIMSELRSNEAIPEFKAGQHIFILSLDVVLKGMVNHSWICNRDDKEPYFGYSVSFDGGGHTVVWDYNIGSTVFDNLRDAENAAAKIAPLIVKLTPSQIATHDCQSFEYYRNCDNYRLEAIIAKVGETQLYEKGFMCYHFLRTYSKKNERDKAYKTALTKIMDESKYANGKEISEAHLIELYRVTDNLFASREYALSNGKEYEAMRKAI